MPDISLGWETLAVIWASTIAISELVDRYWDLEGTAAQVRTWVIGVLLGAVGGIFKFGMFANPEVCGTVEPILCGALVGLTAAIAANFTFLLPVVKWLLEKVKIRPVEKGSG